jgi:hypothetical protein
MSVEDRITELDAKLDKLEERTVESLLDLAGECEALKRGHQCVMKTLKIVLERMVFAVLEAHQEEETTE